MPLALAGAVPAVANTQQQSTVASTSLVFDEVTVVDVEHGQLTPGQRVVITGNRIRAVGRSRGTPVPKGAQVVDARGKYLIPGLWDMHTHPMNSGHLFYPLFIAHGVTGVRDAGSMVTLDTLTEWKHQILDGTRVGPRMIVSGPSIDEVREECERDPISARFHTCVTDSADARHLVDSLQRAGADIIKTYNLSPGLYFTIAAEARRIGIPFGGHISLGAPITPSQASDSGARFLDHLNSSGGLDTFCVREHASVDRCRAVAERFQRNGTWWVPTLLYGAAVGIGGGGRRSWPLYKQVFERVRAFWSDSLLNRYSVANEGKISMTRFHQMSNGDSSVVDSLGTMSIVQRVGLPIVAGSDAWLEDLLNLPPGMGLQAELAMYVAEGMTPLAALQSATLNPAKALHATDSLGTVAVGKLADVVLLDADPLADIQQLAAVRAVVANGHYFDRAALDRLIADVRVAAWNNPR